MKIFDSLKTRWIAWVWNHTPNCAEMSRLASRSLERPPSVRTRLKMRLHYLICAWCRRYFEQIHFLHDSAPQLDLESGGVPGRGLSAEAKNRIAQRIKSGQ
jgi:hypothetical protein